MAKIDKIILDISGKKVELTEKQAKELKDVLSDMFGGKEYIPVTAPSVPYPTPWRYPEPWKYDHWSQPIWDNGRITCCSIGEENDFYK